MALVELNLLLVLFPVTIASEISLNDIAAPELIPEGESNLRDSMLVSIERLLGLSPAVV